MGGSGLAAFLRDHRRLFVITGAGLSAPSGIDTYRDDSGAWRRSAPIQHQDFLLSETVRKRYWARSMRGWPMFRDAEPNPAHRALVALESLGRLLVVLTQNVDGLHQRAGQDALIELHGGISRVVCLGCGRRLPREALQAGMERENPGWLDGPVARRPDGDAAFGAVRQFDDFRLPSCDCGGILKPDVVFYGDSVPMERVEAARADLRAADGLLVVGSSLMVYSSFRFVKEARSMGLPIAAINRGRTRADEWFDCKWETDSATALPELVAQL